MVLDVKSIQKLSNALGLESKILLWSTFIGISLMALSSGSEYWVSSSFSVSKSQEQIAVGDRRFFCNKSIGGGSQFKIDVQVTPFSLKDYQDIFQTASENRGIRLEVDKSGHVVLVAADMSNNYILVNGDSNLLIRKRNRIQIVVYSHIGLSLKVNDGNQVFVPGAPKVVCSNIIVGNGFDNSRGFQGPVTITFSTLENRCWLPFASQFAAIGQFILVGSFLVWFVRNPIQANKKMVQKNCDKSTSQLST